MLTKEQFDRIYFGGRKVLYPGELDVVFQVYREHEGADPGCNTCPDNVTIVKERMFVRIEEYQRHIAAEAQKEKKDGE